MTAQYTYLATDLITDTVIGELPVSNVSLDCQLNTAGNMSSGFKLDDPRIDNNELMARTVPGKTCFWAYRDNTIVWGGIILSREFQSDGKSVSLTGQTFECYANRRFPRGVLGTASQSLSSGQAAMINTLWLQLQSIPGGNINVQQARIPGSDPATTLTVNGYDLSTSYGDLIKSVTQLSDGPDWRVGWFQNSDGTPYKQLIVGTPIGRTIDFTDLVVDYPGSIANYVYTENASSGNNTWYATGDGDPTTQVVGVAVDGNNLASNYPIWEGVNSYSGVTDQGTIDAHAASDLFSLSLPLVTHAVSLTGIALPPFGSYQMGDYIVCNILDSRFPQGTTFSDRVIGWSIQPPDEGQGTEQIALVFDQATGAS